jgi:hypothetical protein
MAKFPNPDERTPSKCLLIKHQQHNFRQWKIRRRIGPSLYSVLIALQRTSSSELPPFPPLVTKSSHHPTPSLLIFSSSINDQYLPSIQQSQLVPRFNRRVGDISTFHPLSSPLPLSTNSKLFLCLDEFLVDRLALSSHVHSIRGNRTGFRISHLVFPHRLKIPPCPLRFCQGSVANTGFLGEKERLSG